MLAQILSSKTISYIVLQHLITNKNAPNLSRIKRVKLISATSNCINLSNSEISFPLLFKQNILLCNINQSSTQHTISVACTKTTLFCELNLSRKGFMRLYQDNKNKVVFNIKTVSNV